jgi:hypothetical protein
LNLSHSLNKPTFTRNSSVDPIEDLHAVVGAYWLNLSPSNLRQVCLHYVMYRNLSKSLLARHSKCGCQDVERL